MGVVRFCSPRAQKTGHAQLKNKNETTKVTDDLIQRKVGIFRCNKLGKEIGETIEK